MDWAHLSRDSCHSIASTRFAEIEGEAAKHLRLAPAVHGNIVPAQM